MRVIVCGGRNYDDHRTITTVLAAFDPAHVKIIHGDAPGADRLAHLIAETAGFTVEAHPADWDAHGRAAGPVRNRKMLSLGAHLVVAFPGGRGTADMVTAARNVGVPVLEVS